MVASIGGFNAQDRPHRIRRAYHITGKFRSDSVRSAGPAHRRRQVRDRRSGPRGDTDTDVQKKYRKIHKVDLVAGRPYVFELGSPQFDCYLFLMDPTDKLKWLVNVLVEAKRLSKPLDLTPFIDESVRAYALKIVKK